MLAWYQGPTTIPQWPLSKKHMFPEPSQEIQEKANDLCASLILAQLRGQTDSNNAWEYTWAIKTTEGYWYDN